MAKTKSATKVAKPKKTAKKGGEDHEDARERHTAETVMQTVLTEARVEAEKVRLDQWVPIECPHCGEGTELHVIAEMDGQSIDQDCTVCCRPFVAHIEIEEEDVHVGVEAS
ncbi:MAG TPA: CPXCG motif-containing cysteine-rich protein [Elusimicrobiota bacterium]|nr:CPXCG motif-containing cysteine-rich protein [Elusimicrobiota bacterium]